MRQWVEIHVLCTTHSVIYSYFLRSIIWLYFLRYFFGLFTHLINSWIVGSTFIPLVSNEWEWWSLNTDQMLHNLLVTFSCRFSMHGAFQLSWEQHINNNLPKWFWLETFTMELDPLLGTDFISLFPAPFSCEQCRLTFFWVNGKCIGIIHHIRKKNYDGSNNKRWIEKKMLRFNNLGLLRSRYSRKSKAPGK